MECSNAGSVTTMVIVLCLPGLIGVQICQPRPVLYSRWVPEPVSQPRALRGSVPYVRSCPFGVSDLAGVLPRPLQVSRTDHGLVDSVVVELAGVAQSVGDELDFGIQELSGPFPCGAERRGGHCGDQGGTHSTRSQQE